MVGFAVFVIGPAGVGKSTFCSALIEYGDTVGRKICLVNLDPAAEHFINNPSKDIRELVMVDDVMDCKGLGPNGGLIECMDYLIENIDWLEDDLGDYEDDYLVIDCPGQIELYTHFEHMKEITKVYQNRGYHVCCVYLLESVFLGSASKFISGVLNALSSMVQLEIPHINVISKMDLIEESTFGCERLEDFLDVNIDALLDYVHEENGTFKSLNEAIVRLVDEFSMVKFFPLSIKDEDSISLILYQIDTCVQYDDHSEVKTKDFH